MIDEPIEINEDNVVVTLAYSYESGWSNGLTITEFNIARAMLKDQLALIHPTGSEPLRPFLRNDEFMEALREVHRQVEVALIEGLDVLNELRNVNAIPKPFLAQTMERTHICAQKKVDGKWVHVNKLCSRLYSPAELLGKFPAPYSLEVMVAVGKTVSVPLLLTIEWECTP